jgi:hypothetical protein
VRLTLRSLLLRNSLRTDNRLLEDGQIVTVLDGLPGLAGRLSLINQAAIGLTQQSDQGRLIARRSSL